MTSNSFFAGIDLGTTSIRAARFTEHGELVDEARWQLTTMRSDDGRATQSPDDWVTPVRDWLTAYPVEAWSIGGQMNTYCLADAAGVPISEAVTWQDRRRSPRAPANLAVTSATARAALFEDEYPEAWSQARYMLLPKDVMLAALTGEALGDRSSWNGVFVPGTSEISPDLPSAVRDKLPRIESSSHQMSSGHGMAVTGLPDTIAVLVGAGYAPGAVYNISGTSETVAGVATEARPSAGFQSSVPLNQSWIHAGPSSVGGVTLQWASDLLTGGDVARLVAEASSITPGDSLPLFVPYLLGERAPLWDATLHGSWQELSMNHGLAQLAWAVVEGIGFSIRLSLARLIQSTRREPSRHLATLRSLELGALRALALGADLEVISDSLVGCRGAAALAFGSARDVDLEVASARFQSEREVAIRNRSLDPVMEERFRRWCAAAAVSASAD